MGTELALQIDFAPAVIRGLVEYGPFDTELSLELGLSVWLHRTATDLADARDAMLGLRTAILESSGINPRSEPFPLIGHAVERDLVNLASYLGSLVTRAATSSDCDAEEVVERALALL